MPIYAGSFIYYRLYRTFWYMTRFVVPGDQLPPRNRGLFCWLSPYHYYCCYMWQLFNLCICRWQYWNYCATLTNTNPFHILGLWVWYVGHPISSDNGLISQKLLLKSEFYYPLRVVIGVAYSCLKYGVSITTWSDAMQNCIQHCETPWPRKSRF